MLCQKNERLEIGLEEFKEEVVAMLKVCFEGKVSVQEDGAQIVFPNGETFEVSVKAAY